MAQCCAAFSIVFCWLNDINKVPEWAPQYVEEETISFRQEKVIRSAQLCCLAVLCFVFEMGEDVPSLHGVTKKILAEV